MRPDLVLEARAWVRGEFQNVEIGLDLESGTILAVKRDLPGTPRRKLPGFVVPSAVDLHVHFREPGAPQKEDFSTGTAGAALGGVGTILDMPNNDPVIDRVSRLDDKIERVASKAHVDWGLWVTVSGATPQPQRLLEAADGLKLYLAETTGMAAPATDADVRARMAWAQAAGRPIAVHAEHAKGGRPRNAAEHDASRSPMEEPRAVSNASNLADPAARFHVAHASTVETLHAAAELARSAGVTPHHLLLAFEDASDPRGKVNPPLRSRARRDALWKAFEGGEVPIIETDHAPHTVDEKARPYEEAPAGIPGVQTAYPLLLQVCRERNVDVGHVIRAYSEHPAAFLGLSKGRIEAGFDADLVVVDVKGPSPIRGGDLASKAGWSPFEGWPTAKILTHYLRGELIVEDGDLVGRPGRGERIKATRTPTIWKSTAQPRAAKPR